MYYFCCSMWDADSCHDNMHKWQNFLMTPKLRFKMIQDIVESLQPILGKGIKTDLWKQEVFFAIELAVPEVFARNNNTGKICDIIFNH